MQSVIRDLLCLLSTGFLSRILPDRLVLAVLLLSEPQSYVSLNVAHRLLARDEEFESQRSFSLFMANSILMYQRCTGLLFVLGTIFIEIRYLL